MIFIIEFLLILIIQLFLIFNIHNYWKEVNEVEFFNDSVLNTIIFN